MSANNRFIIWRISLFGAFLLSHREPIFNVPAVVVATIGVLVTVHVVRVFVLSPQADMHFLLRFAFIPIRYDSAQIAAAIVPNDWGAGVWTFVTYALIHGDASHLGLNSIWLLAFGSAVGRRVGAARFTLFFIITAAAGAAAHLLTHAGEFAPVVGASAAISGYMAAAIRFVFQAGGPLGILGGRDEAAYRQPAAPLRLTLRNPRVMIFLAVWFGLNLAFGLGSLSLGPGGAGIAWEAHIGGFLAGLLLFPLFDPIAMSRGAEAARR